MRNSLFVFLFMYSFGCSLYAQELPFVLQIRCLKLHPDNIPMKSDVQTLSGLQQLWVENILKVISSKNKWLNFSRDLVEPLDWQAANPALSADGKWLLFSANIPGVTMGWDILYCQKSSSGWGNVMKLGQEINTTADEDFPVLISKDKFSYLRNGVSVETLLKESATAATNLSLSFTSVRMYQEVLAQKKEHIPLYLKSTMPIAESREQRVSMKYLPDPGHVYSVQLGKFRHPDWLAIDQFKDLGDIMLYEDTEGYLIVRLGPFESIENANEVMNQIKMRKWFETAFILYED